MTNNFQNQLSRLNLNQENFNDHRNRNTTPKKTNNCRLKELNLQIILDRKFSLFDSPIAVKVFTCIRRFFSWKISMTSSGGKKKERERERQPTEIRYVGRRVGWVGRRRSSRIFSSKRGTRDDRADLLTPGNIVLVGD